MHSKAWSNIKLSVAGHLLGDLEAYQLGDLSRFVRMVGGRGQEIGSKERWEKAVISALSHDCHKIHYPERWEILLSRLNDALSSQKEKEQGK